jgi:hypothetical protein
MWRFQRQIKIQSPIRRHTINAVAVKLETSIVKDEIYSPTSFIAKNFHSFPETVEVVPEDVLFGSGEVVSAG